VGVAEQAHGEAMNEDQRGALETALRYFREARMVKELDLFESNHGCGLNALSQGKYPKRT
jgi:hypothetical protein